MSFRRLATKGLQLLRACEGLNVVDAPLQRNIGVFGAPSQPCRACQSRMFARLPYESDSLSKITLRDGSKLPPPPPPKVKRPVDEAEEKVTFDQVRQNAQAVTDSMFPWERRHMDGGATGLTSWERFYWGAFATAAVILIGVQIYKSFKRPPPVVDESREQRKAEAGYKLSKGAVNILQCDDLFEGMSPEDISKFAVEASKRKLEEARAASSEKDEYDGLTPDEINALVNAGQGQQAS